MKENDESDKDVYMATLRDDTERLIEYYEKYEYRDSEMMKFYDLDK